MIGPVYFHLFRHSFIESLAINTLFCDLINRSSPSQNKTLNLKVKSGKHAESENIKFCSYFMSL